MAKLMPLSAVALLLAMPALANAPSVPPPPDDVVPLASDPTLRMTVPVSIDGSGPYRFLVDTGAERTVISTQLAGQLGLRAGETARMHSITEASDVRTVVIPSLETGRGTVKDIQAPALDSANLGAAGLLGIDSLKAQRVMLDFKRGTMTVSPSSLRERDTGGDEGVIVVRGRSRFGQLVLTDARIGAQRIRVIIDTGAQVTIGNFALRRKLLGDRAPPKERTVPIELVSVTGGKLLADYTAIRQIRIGGATLNDMPIAFADAQPFRKFGLANQPALLLGMDALRMFDRVSVDFANRQVRFILPGGANRADDVRTAAVRGNVRQRDKGARGLEVALN